MKNLILQVDPDDIKWHITRFEVCINCGGKGCYDLIPILVNTWDLTLADPHHAASIILKGVTVFDLAKGDVIAVEGKDDESGNFWCEKFKFLLLKWSKVYLVISVLIIAVLIIMMIAVSKS